MEIGGGTRRIECTLDTEAAQLAGKDARVAEREKGNESLANFAKNRDVAGKHRQPVAQRLNQRQAESFADRRIDQRRRTPIAERKLSVGGIVKYEYAWHQLGA